VAPANQIYGDPTRPHAITSRTDTSKVYEYDADGNVTRRGGQYLKYNSLNQVECVGSSPASCDLAVYGYDAAGTLAYEASTGETRIFVEDLFVWQTSNNQAISHVFANGRQIGEQQRNSASLRTGWLPPGWTFPVDPADLLLAALGASGVLLLVLAWRSGTIALIATRPRQASTAIFLGIAVLTPAPALAGGGSGSITRRLTHQDQLGTRVLLVSDTPDVIYRRVFEPFGEVVAESVGTEGQIRYLTGKRESVATRDGVGGPGLVNFGARWYDPEIGRFLSIDPIVQAVGDPQTHNPYTYVRNDPVGLIDPNGLGFEKTFKRIVGGLAIAVGVILIAYQVPQAGYGMITYGVGLILETASDQRTQSWGLGL
jgi:RHS repeat-associated protein